MDHGSVQPRKAVLHRQPSVVEDPRCCAECLEGAGCIPQSGGSASSQNTQLRRTCWSGRLLEDSYRVHSNVKRRLILIELQVALNRIDGDKCTLNIEIQSLGLSSCIGQECEGTRVVALPRIHLCHK